MASLQVVIVTRPIDVWWHAREVVTVVLLANGLAKNKSSDLCHGVRGIGGFRPSRQEGCLRNGLWRLSRINATRPEEAKVRNFRLMSPPDEIGFNNKVESDKVRWIGAVRTNTTNFGSGHDNPIGSFGG